MHLTKYKKNEKKIVLVKYEELFGTVRTCSKNWLVWLEAYIQEITSGVETEYISTYTTLSYFAANLQI